MYVAFIAFTPRGNELAIRLAQGLEQQGVQVSTTCGFGPEKVSHKEWTEEKWAQADALVFVGATGIAVRSVAPYVTDKGSDPAVVVLDEFGKNCIPVLSGHLGGANKLAKTLGDYCGARTILTTASDLNGVFAVDTWSAEQGLLIPDTSGIKVVTGQLLAGKEVLCTTNVPISGEPPKGVRVVTMGQARQFGFKDIPGFHVGARLSGADLDIVCPSVILGIGCRKGTSDEVIESAVSSFLEERNVHPASLISIASVDLKAEEPGLLAFAEKRGVPFVTFDSDTLNAQEGEFSTSEFVQGVTGTTCVCERAAVAAGGTLVESKTVVEGITIALAVKNPSLSWPEVDAAVTKAAQPSRVAAEGTGELWVVGLGPGDPAFMAQEAVEVLQNVDVICGYHVYVDLAKQVAPETPVFTTPMTKEIDRCREAIERAVAGDRVAMVCSGDSGVYGMAGLCMELAPEYPAVDIKVVPGITAALSGASCLGAPLTHDFCVISLSDLLTPWELIEKRLEAAGMADFCVALYNPASRKRSDYLQKACDILMRNKTPETVCGVVRNIGRPGQETWVGTLSELRNYECDMFCTVFIGNAHTQIIQGRMITPRGYENKPERSKRPLGAGAQE